MNRLNDIEKRIIHELGGDIGDGDRPFADLAERLGLSEETVLDVIRNLDDRGLVRRFGATLRHQRSGFIANAMVAWLVDPAVIEEVGDRMAALPEVTHCYQRRTAPVWPYNVYTMIHASSYDEIHKLAEHISEITGVTDYQILFSHKELKKTSMRYFP